MRRILAMAGQPGGPRPGVVLDECTPEFAALEIAVRTQLANPVAMRATTEFTNVPAGCLSCVHH